VTGPDPAVAGLRGAVKASLVRRLAGLPAAHATGPAPLTLVACSGGADSLALAAAAAFAAPRAGFRAGAVVVDHGLQAGSAQVAGRAAATCRRLGLDPVQVVAVNVGRQGGLEAAARTARYAALERAASLTGAVAVLLGHTLNDQAETVLLALGRGSGLTALAGMAAQAGLFDRPLLGLRRADTEAACAAQGLTPWHDPMNPATVRGMIRSAILPQLEAALGGGVAAALARTAVTARRDTAYLDQAAQDVLAAVAVPERQGLVLDAKALAQSPPALRHRALHGAALAWGTVPGALNARHVAALDALVVGWRGQGPVSLPGRVSVGRRCGKLEPLTDFDAITPNKE
jgi:tRNA(Ile)-lysidine synthase